MPNRSQALKTQRSRPYLQTENSALQAPQSMSRRMMDSPRTTATGQKGVIEQLNTETLHEGDPMKLARA